MAFLGEPTVEDLVLDGDGLRIRLVSPDDAEDAYNLLTHPDLANLPGPVPEQPADYADFAAGIQDRTANTEDFRLYAWSVRIAESGELVGLITASIDAVSPDYRPVELTAYFHPEHQGKKYFSKSSRRVLGFAHHRFVATHQLAMIHESNEIVAAMADAAGLVKQPGQSVDGYETWIAPLPPLPG